MDLFPLHKEKEPPPHQTCKNCEHRERHQCGGRIIQYCGVRRSNRTSNGLLKIKCKTKACVMFQLST